MLMLWESLESGRYTLAGAAGSDETGVAVRKWSCLVPTKREMPLHILFYAAKTFEALY
jgi:hypothetical protein